MTAENSILKAEVVVINAETAYIKKLADKIGGLDTVLRPKGSNIVIARILEEKERLDPKGKYDEEEFMIGNLERKKKRR